MKKRDINIIKNYRREISLKTRIKESKKRYKRRVKHKLEELYYNTS